VFAIGRSSQNSLCRILNTSGVSTPSVQFGSPRETRFTVAIPSFTDNQLRTLSENLVGAFTHKELTSLLNSCGIVEQGGTPRWERALLALTHRQQQDRCANNVAAFIQAAMDPVRFINRQQEFVELRNSLNRALAFSGLQLGEDGKLHQVSSARTLSEAETMADQLRSELRRRKVHTDVLKFCRAELLNTNPPNYFHAVLEATKSVAQKLRDQTGLTGDGAEIVDDAFRISSPLLAINSLRTETEQSEQKGFSNLLKGMFGTFRNVTSHAPKIIWPVSEQDALDLLSIVSYLHRRLDAAVQIGRIQP
jgi:uncharacterized protein (TIGR02391 family)